MPAITWTIDNSKSSGGIIETVVQREVPRMQKLTAPLVGAQGYQKFHLPKPVAGQNISLYAAPAYRASIHTFCLSDSVSFK